MKAIILDYCDGTIMLLPIPQEWENDADEFVRAHPCYDDSCMYHMVNDGDTFEVYDIVQTGEDIDAYPFYDYIKKTEI